jgi:hypothetical protein
MVGEDFSHPGPRIHDKHSHARDLTKQRSNGLDSCGRSS